MTAIPQSEVKAFTPLDVVEQIVSANDWVFDRPSDEEIAVRVPGRDAGHCRDGREEFRRPRRYTESWSLPGRHPAGCA